MKEAEEIIMAKNFCDLSREELDIVNELVQNEVEFDEMKWLLGEVKQVYSQEKIEASHHLKKGVLTHLNASENKKGFWTNRMGVFLLPRDKKGYQKPGLQILLAAVFIIGLLFVVQHDFKKEQLAINARERTIESVSTEESTPLKESENNPFLDAEELSEGMDKTEVKGSPQPPIHVDNMQNMQLEEALFVRADAEHSRAEKQNRKPISNESDDKSDSEIIGISANNDEKKAITMNEFSHTDHLVANDTEILAEKGKANAVKSLPIDQIQELNGLFYSVK